MENINFYESVLWISDQKDQVIFSKANMFQIQFPSSDLHQYLQMFWLNIALFFLLWTISPTMKNQLTLSYLGVIARSF